MVYFRRNQDAASFNQVSSVVAAAKRRHSTKTPPSANRGDEEVDNPSELLPPPPEVPEGAGEAALERAVKRRNLYEESRSLQHLMTHSPPNPYCRACTLGKGLRIQHRKGALKRHGGKPTKEGELLTMDWIILHNEVSRGEGGETVLQTLLDVGTDISL